MALPLSSVSWKEHSNTLSTICKDLIDNFFVDCTISAEGQCLKAHRLILSACSPYFHMLFSEEREKHPILILKDVTFDTLKSVIDFVYLGEIQIPKGDLKSFLELAESLQIKGLNESSMKDVCEPFICDASGGICHGPSSDNHKDTFEVRSPSVSRASNESSFEQLPLYHSYGYTDTVQINSCPSFEESNRAHEKEKSILEMALSQEKNVPVLPSEQCEDTEIKVKEEPLQPECVVVKCEQIDEYDELVQEDNTDDTEECGAPPFTKQNLDQYPTIASTHVKSANVVPDAVRVPQMIQSPNAQGVASTCMASTSGLPNAVRIPPMIGPAKTPGEAVPPADQDGQGVRPATDGPTFPSSTQVQMPGSGPQPFGHSATTSSSSAADHKRKHRGERPFTCHECGMAFVRSNHLVDHKRTHTGERPHRCNLCGKAYNQKGGLVVHMRTHTGERPYRCDECGNSFDSSSKLVVHKRRHTGERPYGCDVCGMAFAQISTLATHKRRHTGERPFCCDLCGKTFMQSTALSFHRRKHHAEEQS